MWYVYMVRCADGTLYTGITKNIARRIRQHNGAISGGARYTTDRRPVTLVFKKTAASLGAAMRRERAMKKLTHAEKQRLYQL